eukprot:jgi/Astpho2/897/fgenesh1_pg.00016_%23_99_t
MGLLPCRAWIAVAYNQQLAVLATHPSNATSTPGQGPQGPHSQDPSATACPFDETITALMWVTFAKAQPGPLEYEDSCVLVGTSSGHLQLHADDGFLLHRQRLHASSPVVSIAARACGMGLRADDMSEDVTITLEAAVVRLSALEVRSLLRMQQQTRRWGELQAANPWAYNIWETGSKVGPCKAGLCLGLKAPTLHQAMTGRDTPPKLLIVTAGENPCLAAFEAEERPQKGVLRMLGKLAGGVAVGVAGLARAAVSGRENGYRAGIGRWLTSKVAGSGEAGGSSSPPGSPAAATTPQKEEDLPRGEPVPLFRSLQDPPRRVHHLLVAPRGCLAAASDALGRVLLVDVASLTVIRVWKAYRNAQMAWLMLDVPAREQHMVLMEADQLKSGADEEDKAEAEGISTLHAALDAARRAVMVEMVAEMITA